MTFKLSSKRCEGASQSTRREELCRDPGPVARGGRRLQGPGRSSRWTARGAQEASGLQVKSWEGHCDGLAWPGCHSKLTFAPGGEGTRGGSDVRARRRVPGESVTWRWGRADAAGSEAHLETVDTLGGHCGKGEQARPPPGLCLGPPTSI